MIFLIDENLPAELLSIAKGLQFEAIWVRDWLPGTDDLTIFERLKISKEILVTRDIGFANMILKSMVKGESLEGVLLIREQKMSLIRSVWQNYLLNPISPDGLIVLTEKGCRIHRIHEY